MPTDFLDQLIPSSQLAIHRSIPLPGAFRQKLRHFVSREETRLVACRSASCRRTLGHALTHSEAGRDTHILTAEDPPSSQGGDDTMPGHRSNRYCGIGEERPLRLNLVNKHRVSGVSIQSTLPLVEISGRLVTKAYIPGHYYGRSSPIPQHRSLRCLGIPVAMSSWLQQQPSPYIYEKPDGGAASACLSAPPARFALARRAESIASGARRTSGWPLRVADLGLVEWSGRVPGPWSGTVNTDEVMLVNTDEPFAWSEAVTRRPTPNQPTRDTRPRTHTAAAGHTAEATTPPGSHSSLPVSHDAIPPFPTRNLQPSFPFPTQTFSAAGTHRALSRGKPLSSPLDSPPTRANPNPNPNLNQARAASRSRSRRGPRSGLAGSSSLALARAALIRCACPAGKSGGGAGAMEEDSPMTKTVKGAVTGLAAGTIWGTVVATWYDVPRVERHVALPGLIRTLKMCGTYGATFATIGGLYIGVEQLVQSQRKKRDFVNGAVGAFVAGASVCGYRGEKLEPIQSALIGGSCLAFTSAVLDIGGNTTRVDNGKEYYPYTTEKKPAH
ncbi:hypothetical protein HU200_017606 [Digitaria exilis]|uniref:Uncharacterized protein n=1 Tax=Digitaria exilis TaxID=1010633 RepID=A0A835F695_9POAL|nr:hypothetical protein HU200_017606 [Digitaria exilis]